MPVLRALLLSVTAVLILAPITATAGPYCPQRGPTCHSVEGRFWMKLTKDKLGGWFFINGDQAVRLRDGTRN